MSDYAKLLASSIASMPLDPILIKVESDGKYRVLRGHRRFAAIGAFCQHPTLLQRLRRIVERFLGR
jgi:hypothetical protein